MSDDKIITDNYSVKVKCQKCKKIISYTQAKEIWHISAIDFHFVCPICKEKKNEKPS